MGKFIICVIVQHVPVCVCGFVLLTPPHINLYIDIFICTYKQGRKIAGGGGRGERDPLEAYLVTNCYLND